MRTGAAAGSPPQAAIAIAERTPEVRAAAPPPPRPAARERHPLPQERQLGDQLLVRRASCSRTSPWTGTPARCVEAWQGIQAGWLMARGHDGYFGETFDEWYVWLPLCLLFLAPFFDPRRPFRMLHVDLLVLLGGFGASHFFFNKGEIGTSVPLVYPVLAYFLVRMLVARVPPASHRRAARPVRAGRGARGRHRAARRLSHRPRPRRGQGRRRRLRRARSAPPGSRTNQPLYVDSGKDDQHFDTYGPVNYLAYDPFVRIWKPSQKEIDTPDDYELPAARAAAIVFDALTVLGLFLLGMRLRRGREGRLLGLALAYGWVSFPYTLFPLMTTATTR